MGVLLRELRNLDGNLPEGAGVEFLLPVIVISIFGGALKKGSNFSILSVSPELVIAMNMSSRLSKPRSS